MDIAKGLLLLPAVAVTAIESKTNIVADCLATLLADSETNSNKNTIF